MCTCTSTCCAYTVDCVHVLIFSDNGLEIPVCEDGLTGDLTNESVEVVIVELEKTLENVSGAGQGTVL